jgi:hypothetical protein
VTTTINGNATLCSAGGYQRVAIAATQPFAGGGTPVQITTAAAHGFNPGDTVEIGGTQDPAAAGTWAITVQSSTVFSLNGSSTSAVFPSATGYAIDYSIAPLINVPAATENVSAASSNAPIEALFNIAPYLYRRVGSRRVFLQGGNNVGSEPTDWNPTPFVVSTGLSTGWSGNGWIEVGLPCSLAFSPSLWVPHGSYENMIPFSGAPPVVKSGDSLLVDVQITLGRVVWETNDVMVGTGIGIQYTAPGASPGAWTLLSGSKAISLTSIATTLGPSIWTTRMQAFVPIVSANYESTYNFAVMIQGVATNAGIYPSWPLYVAPPVVCTFHHYRGN